MPKPTSALTLSLLACLLSIAPACAIDTDADLSTVEAAIEANPDLTPGSLCSDSDPDFDGYRYAEQIPHCRRKVSASRKTRVYEAYGIPTHARAGYEVDHRISLFVGGDNSVANLWPLPDADARRKARVEGDLYLELRAGDITQAEVIEVLLSWK